MFQVVWANRSLPIYSASLCCRLSTPSCTWQCCNGCVTNSSHPTQACGWANTSQPSNQLPTTACWSAQQPSSLLLGLSAVRTGTLAACVPGFTHTLAKASIKDTSKYSFRGLTAWHWLLRLLSFCLYGHTWELSIEPYFVTGQLLYIF
jgi:hypothetical protein